MFYTAATQQSKKRLFFTFFNSLEHAEICGKIEILHPTESQVLLIRMSLVRVQLPEPRISRVPAGTLFSLIFYMLLICYPKRAFTLYLSQLFYTNTYHVIMHYLTYFYKNLSKFLLPHPRHPKKCQALLFKPPRSASRRKYTKRQYIR